jgi:hypothetical protein
LFGNVKMIEKAEAKYITQNRITQNRKKNTPQHVSPLVVGVQVIQGNCNHGWLSLGSKFGGLWISLP